MFLGKKTSKTWKNMKLKTVKDFSEVLKINVFVLGKTFIQLTRALNITLPLLDPAFYIYRFAHKLGKWLFEFVLGLWDSQEL